MFINVDIRRWYYEAEWNGRKYYYIQLGAEGSKWYGMWYSKDSGMHENYINGNPFIKTYKEHHND